MFIRQNQYKVIQFDPAAEGQVYSAMPLITCFAYTIFFQSGQDEKGAVLYHVGSGDPTPLKQGFKELNGVTYTHAVIAVPDQLSEKMTRQLIDEGKRILASTYNIPSKQVVVVEEAACYQVNTAGQHGIGIEKPSIKSKVEADKVTFLENLNMALRTREFIVENWLGEKVTGTPDGVKALKCLLENWEQDKTDAAKVVDIYGKVIEELYQRVSTPSSSRDKRTAAFYQECYDKMIEMVAGQTQASKKHHF